MPYIGQNNEINQIPFVNLEQAFEFAEVKIASNNNTIIYIVNFPITNVLCNKLIIKPIKFSKFVNNKFQDVLNCNKSYYGINQKCKSYYGITFCNKRNLVNMDNNSCFYEPKTKQIAQLQCGGQPRYSFN